MSVILERQNCFKMNVTLILNEILVTPSQFYSSSILHNHIQVDMSFRQFCTVKLHEGLT